MYTQNHKFTDLLNEFPKVTTSNLPQHQKIHYIETQGPPIFERPRRLSPEKLKIAKKVFEYMISQGIC